MIAPLLERTNSALYTGYRRAYADLLFLWGQPLSRLEVLKFNGLEDSHWDELKHRKSFAESVKSEDTMPQDIAAHDKTSENGQTTITPTHVGLDAKGYCLKYDTALEPGVDSTKGGATGHCNRCKIDHRQLRCTICLEPVVANYIPCLSCSCVTHRDCLRLYHESGSTMCSAGCDCDCSAMASEGIIENRDLIDRFRDHPEEDIEEETEDFETDGRSDWEKISGAVESPAVEGLGMALSKRIEQVRAADWGLSGVKKRAQSLRNLDMS